MFSTSVNIEDTQTCHQLMNEKEFQTYTATVIAQLFPTLLPAKIEMEHSFSLKFGHHQVLIDGKEPGNYAKRSIFDILLKIDGKPIVLLELKKPGKDIEEEDVRQGVSYARLTTPITPLTVLSNGSATRLINTYTAEDLDIDTVDLELVDKLLSQALKLSQNELKNSISTLFENDHRIIFDVINSVTDSAFKSLTGEIQEIRKPLINDFIIPRKGVSGILKALDDNTGVILTGDPFVGKTTIVYQLFEAAKESGHALFYINSVDQGYNLFRRLAVFITTKMAYMVDENKVKEWLLLGFNRTHQDRFVVVFDHLRYDAESALKSEIVELYDLFQPHNNRIILVTDNSNYDLLCHTEGRQAENFFSKNFKQIKLETFSPQEFEIANHLLAEQFGGGILPGGSYSGEYRNPRLWRLLGMVLLNERESPDTFGVVDPVPSLRFLKLINNYLQFDPQTVQDFRDLTKAYLEALPVKDANRNIQLMALNLPMVEETELKKHVSSDVIRRLEASGFIEKRLVPEHIWVYLPKVPELIAGFAIDYVKVKFLSLLQHDFDSNYQNFMDTCQYLPLGEIIAARIIIDWAYANEIEVLSRFIKKLQEDKPVIESSSGGMLVRLYLPGKGYEDVEIPPGEEQKFVNNLFPYLVLSHLTEMRFVDDSKHPDMERARCIIAVGETDFMVRSLNVNTIYETVPTIDVGNIGNVIQSDIGIIEPIVQSIQMNIMETPTVVEALFRYAMDQKSYRLFHRIYIGAKFTPYLGRPESDELCKRIVERYMEHFNKMMAFALAPAGANRTERRRVEKKLNKMDTKRKR